MISTLSDQPLPTTSSTTSPLRKLNLKGLGLQGSDLVHILKKIHATHPNLKELDVSQNMIVSMIDILEEGPNINNNNNLESINLSCNPLWQTIQFSVEEEMALQQFVYDNNRLGFVGYEVHNKQMEEKEINKDGSSNAFWTQLQHVLDMNKVGRCLYDYSSTSSNRSAFDTKQRSRHVPVALLPKVLERTHRVFEEEDDDVESASTNSRSASATFHLLQGFIMEHMGGRL